jgi:hypothetical protein
VHDNILYLHLGLSKTGSTFFQKEILPGISGIRCLDKPMSDLVDGKFLRDGILSRFFGVSPAIWDELGEALFAELLGPPDEREAPRSVLISDEGVLVSWSRDPFSVGQHLERCSRMASRWNFSRVKVLFTFRRQDTWLASSYTQESDRLRGASQAQFEHWVRSWLNKKNGYYETGIRLDYALLYRRLVEVIGEPNVLMLPYELMKEDLSAFYQQWFAYLGITEEGEAILRRIHSRPGARNERHTDSHTWALRAPIEEGVPFLRLRPGRAFTALGLPRKVYLRRPDLKRGKTIRLTPSLRREILECYANSNLALGQALKMNLSSYGYY